MPVSYNPIVVASLIDCGWIGEAPWADILVPLGSAACGATLGALVSRHLRREELYVSAAEDITRLVDDAVEALNSIDRSIAFDPVPVAEARRAIELAGWHSQRLGSEEVTNRLSVTGFVLWDMLQDSDYNGLHWAHQSIEDVMATVVSSTSCRGGWAEGEPKPAAEPVPEHVQELQGLDAI